MTGLVTGDASGVAARRMTSRDVLGELSRLGDLGAVALLQRKMSEAMSSTAEVVTSASTMLYLFPWKKEEMSRRSRGRSFASP